MFITDDGDFVVFFCVSSPLRLKVKKITRLNFGVRNLVDVVFNCFLTVFFTVFTVVFFLFFLPHSVFFFFNQAHPTEPTNRPQAQKCAGLPGFYVYLYIFFGRAQICIKNDNKAVCADSWRGKQGPDIYAKENAVGW